MTEPVFSAQALAPTKWPWLSNRILAVWVFIMAVLWLGLTLTAAARIECRLRSQYLLNINGERIMLEDGSGFLLLEEKRRECGIVW